MNGQKKQRNCTLDQISPLGTSNVLIMSKSKLPKRKRKEVVIETLDDLLAITKQIDPWKPPTRAQFLLQLPYLSHEEQTYYGQKLSKSFSSCGCDSGAALGLFSLVAYITIIGFTSGSFGWKHLLFGLIVFSLASLIGKLTGLTRSNYRVKKIIRTLSNMENENYRLNN